MVYTDHLNGYRCLQKHCIPKHILHHRMHAQVIKKWYAELPDKLGKVLAQQKASDHQKTSEDMEEEDDEQEEEHLKKEGWKEEDIEEAVPYDEDPVTVGT